MPKALSEIFRLVGRANKYIDETTPWILAKDESKKSRLATVLYNLSECVRIAAVNLLPFIPKAPVKILSCYGINAADIKDIDTASRFGALKEGTAVEKSQPIFPRIDIKKELKAIEEMMVERHKEAEKQKRKEEKQAKNEEKTEKTCDGATEEIDIDEFFKTDLRVAEVLTCEKVVKSKKLLLFTLDLGEEVRTVVSGIAQYYTPEELIGTKVVLVANLKPAKLCGIESQGMILCSDDGDGVRLVRPDKDAVKGSRIR